MRHRLSTTSAMLLLLLLAIGAPVLFGLARQHLPPATQSAAPQAAIAQLATPLPDDGWPTPLPPGVTNTPPTPTPGIFYLLDEVPPGVEIAPAIPDEPEMPEPATPAMGESPTPIPLPPTVTPLPTVSLDNRSPYAAHNLVLAPGPTPVSEKLRSPTSEQVTHGFASWSPDGSLFALTEGVGEYKFYPDLKYGGGTYWRPQVIVLFDATGQEIGTLIEGTEPHWSPSGAYLAILGWDMEQEMGSVKVIELDTRRVATVATLTLEHKRVLMVWISDTELLYYLGKEGGGNLIIFNIVSGEQHPLLTETVAEEIAKAAPGEDLRVTSALPSKDLISIWTINVLFILQRDSAGLRIVHKLERSAAAPVVFAPDGESIAYPIGDSLQIVSLSHIDQQPVEIYVGYPPWPLIWSPDSSSLVFPSREHWYIVNQDGSGLRQLIELHEDTYMVQWTPQGLWTMYGEGGESQAFVVATQ